MSLLTTGAMLTIGQYEVQSGSYNSCGGFSGGKKYRISSPKSGGDEVRAHYNEIWKVLKLILRLLRFTAALLRIVAPRVLSTGSRLGKAAGSDLSRCEQHVLLSWNVGGVTE